MYKVLIADDNALIRESIIKRVPWDELHMECVGTAVNGKQTAELIANLHPDIVITDIKMPIADGFYAIREARDHDHDHNIQFIVISGYHDFVYLKQSIQLQIVDYILKPIDTEELIDSLKKAAKNLDTKQTSLSYKPLYDRKQTNEIFSRYIYGNYDFQTFAECLSEYRYPVFEEYCQCLCLNWAVADCCRDILDEAQCEKLESELEALCVPSACRVLCMYHNTYLILLTHAEQAALSQPMLQRIQRYVSSLAGETLPLYLSVSEVLPVSELPQAGSHVLALMLYRFCKDGENQTIFHMPSSPSVPVDISLPDQELTLAFELQLYEECKRIIGEVLVKASSSWNIFCSLVPHLISLLDILLSRSGGEKLLVGQKWELYLLLYADIEHLKTALFQMIDKLPPASGEGLGEKAVRYIQRNYRNPLTLQKLSELFFVNQIYLGQLIRRQTGKSFNVLLNELRMTEAKHLILNEPGIPLASLAFSLGYTDAHYFTKVFKRFYGMTPSEMKKEQ